MNGRWVEGPGGDFFDTVRDRLGKLPILAEDLGVITPEVEELRDRFEFPGMRILQFAFGTMLEILTCRLTTCATAQCIQVPTITTHCRLVLRPRPTIEERGSPPRSL